MSDKPIPLETARELAQLYIENNTLTEWINRISTEDATFDILLNARKSIGEGIWEIVSRYIPKVKE